MENNYTFESLKDEETLVKFLEKVWKAGLLTGMSTKDTYKNTVDKYMPKFKDNL